MVLFGDDVIYLMDGYSKYVVLVWLCLLLGD